MTPLLVGVDVGTTNLKVGIFDEAGRMQQCAQRDCAPRYLPGGRVETDAPLWWDAFCGAFEDCLRSAERGAIRAIGLSSQAQTYVFLDKAGEALGPAVSWLDTTGDRPGTERDLAPYDYYEHTGWAEADPMLAGPKLRRHAGEDARERAERMLFPDGYMIWRLTGAAAVSRNMAAMSGLFSMVDGGWWDAAVLSARVAPRLLPEVRDMGEPAGTLRPELAARWGIPRVPVVAGANDQTTAAVGVGLAEPGEVTLGLGTALAAYQVVRPDAPIPAGRPLRGPYIGGLHYQLGVCSTGGAALEWAKGTLAPGCDWSRFYAEALSAPPGAEGLRVSPSLEDGAAIAGITLAHGRAALLRAVLEGVACVAREHLDMLSAPGTVKVTGGGSANDGWMQLLADVTGRGLQRVDQPQASLRGAAIMAGHGAGLFPDMLQTTRALRPGGKTFAPSHAHRGTYDQVLRECAALRKLRT